MLSVLTEIGPQPHPWWPNDHAVPVRHCHVLIVHQAPADGAIPPAFLTVLQLFQKPKIPRHCARGGEHVK